MGSRRSRPTSRRNSAPLGPYSRTMPRALRWSWGGGQFLMSEAPLYTGRAQHHAASRLCHAGALDPEPETRSLKSKTRNPWPSTLKQTLVYPGRAQHHAASRLCHAGALHPEASTRNPKPETRNPRPETPDPQLRTLNPRP